MDRFRNWFAEQRKSRLRRTAMDVALFLVLYLGLRAYRMQGVVTGLAPSVEVENARGQVTHVGGPHASAHIVHFEATWCGVCQAMNDNIERVAHLRPGQMTIVVSQSPDDRARSVSVEGAEVALDPHGVLASQYGVEAYPATFFLDSSGRIQATEVGFTSTVGLLARLVWAAL